ncbi:MAG: histidine kinase dimerization/phospho-acceptor domain-containing protein, partial [Bryobacteraceae bacterium]
MLSWPLAVVWLSPDFKPEAHGPAFAKLFALLSLVSAAGLAFIYALSRKWSVPVERLERFALGLPAVERDLPEDGPPELQSLSRAMEAMAERVRQVVERANLESYRRETILGCLAEGVLAVDTSLRVIFCNDAFARAFNARTPVSEGRPLYELVREPVLRDIFERVVETGAAERHRLQLPTAAGRWFEGRALPLGETTRRGAVIVLHDITDLQRQEQVRKDFVADVSHELRTPLAAIRGYAETLL